MTLSGSLRSIVSHHGAFEVIAVDPPWKFSGNSAAKPGRNCRRHYPTMTLDEIAALPVGELASENALLCLWITTPMIAVGAHLPIMKAWGFAPSGVGFTWAKLRPNAPDAGWNPSDFAVGTGMTTRKNVELCLFGKRGRSLRIRGDIRELIVSPRREHSRKPEEFYERVEAYAGERRRLELFARQERPGWIAHGLETAKFEPLARAQTSFLEAAE